ncbi:polysaccharide deacetylase family protein [Streptococcus ruminantium]|uniref:polysaccharide deacetylase family protein n=1 Tax=Streptococcus ruminantium TaxID=1917441 RepID=UPI0012DEA947|nr:polysaccharide deacetylase family protein [Streptococcus ruminantium]
MRKFFWLGVNIALIGMIVGLGFWLFTEVQDRQIRQFIEEKQETILSEGKVNVQEGNIGTTHVVMALPTDNSGRVIGSVESRMLSYVQKRFGHKKPVGKIDELVFISAKEAETSFTDVKARDIQAEQYKVEYLQIKKQENLSAESVLLTEDNQLFTLEKFLPDLSAARKIMVAHLKEDLQAKGMTKAESEGIIAKFNNLDLNTLSFTYKEKQLFLQFPDQSFGIDHLKVPISDLYPVVKSNYLAESDKTGYDEYVAKQVDKKQLRQIALTFDDGPNSNTTPVVLDLLKKYNAKATFFVIGRAIAGNEAILRRMVAEGHVIANHTWNHPDLVTLSPELVRKEIQDTQAAIKEAAGVVPTMVRPPYGTINQSVVDQIGLPSIYWSVDSKDWQSRNPQAILNEIKAQTHPGSIILMHDIHQPTVDSLESVLQFLTSERYNMVTVPDLLGSNLNPKHIYYSQESSGPVH